jgi:hypothetical protein
MDTLPDECLLQIVQYVLTDKGSFGTHLEVVLVAAGIRGLCKTLAKIISWNNVAYMMKTTLPVLAGCVSRDRARMIPKAKARRRFRLTETELQGIPSTSQNMYREVLLIRACIDKFETKEGLDGYNEQLSATAARKLWLKKQSMERRKEELQQEFLKQGMDIMPDCSLCREYIVHNRFDVDFIVSTMVETSFLYQRTNYASTFAQVRNAEIALHGHYDRDHVESVARELALEDYARRNPYIDNIGCNVPMCLAATIESYQAKRRKTNH